MFKKFFLYLLISTSFLFAYSLDITVNGESGGKVYSSDGINCGLGNTKCSENIGYDDSSEELDFGALFADPEIVILSAEIKDGYIFKGWGGDCIGTSTTCKVTMDTNKNVTATFESESSSEPEPESNTNSGNGADLAITDVELIGEIKPDSSVKFRITYKNIGNETALETLTDAYYKKNGKTTPFNNTSPDKWTKKLAPNESTTFDFEVEFQDKIIPPNNYNGQKESDNILVSGDSYVIFEIPYYSDNDSNPSNNKKEIKITYDDKGMKFEDFYIGAFNAYKRTANYPLYSIIGDDVGRGSANINFGAKDDLKVTKAIVEYRTNESDSWHHIQTYTNEYDSISEDCKWDIPNEDKFITGDMQIRVKIYENETTYLEKISYPFPIYSQEKITFSKFDVDKSNIAKDEEITFKWNATGGSSKTLYTVFVKPASGTNGWEQLFSVQGQLSKTAKFNYPNGEYSVQIKSGSNDLLYDKNIVVSDSTPTKMCITVITPAYNPETGEELDFSTPCDVPDGWIEGKAPAKTIPPVDNVSLVSEESVIKLYIATFNRAPDKAGLDYWIKDSGLNIDQIAQSFFDQAETKALYPADSTNSNFVIAIYINIFGREPEQAGLDYWVNELEKPNNPMHRSIMIQALKNGALGDDAKLLENKAKVAQIFVDEGLNDPQKAKDVLKNITKDEGSIATAWEKIESAVDNDTNTTFSYRDDFDTLNKDFWYIVRIDKNWKNNILDYDSVTLSNGELNLEMDRTDDGPVMYSKPLKVKKGDIVTIKRKVYVHPENRYFSGGLTIFSSDDDFSIDTNESLAGILHYDYSYQGDWNTFLLNDRFDSSNFIEPIWDNWFEEELTYDTATGLSTYKIGDKTVTNTNKILNKDYIKIKIGSFGWWTGHYTKMDYIDISIK